MKSLETQVGGSHYKGCKIQPVEFCEANGLGACQSAIVKYAVRFKDKGGRKDLEKIIHYAQILIDLNYPDSERLDEEKPKRPLQLSDFKVGQVWRTRRGRVATIVSIYAGFSEPIIANIGGTHCSFFPDGAWLHHRKPRDYDLVELMEDAV